MSETEHELVHMDIGTTEDGEHFILNVSETGLRFQIIVDDPVMYPVSETHPYIEEALRRALNLIETILDIKESDIKDGEMPQG